MVDRNQLKNADPVALEDDDPFAELTRIMGFDPRQPVSRPAAQQAAYEPATQTDDFGGDDLSIDLEKELMGEFGADEDFAEPAQSRDPVAQEQFEQQPYEQAAKPQDDAQAFADDDALAFAGDDALAFADDEADLTDDLDFDFVGELDDVVAASVEGEELVPEATAADELAATDELDFDLRPEDDLVASEATYEPVEVVDAAVAEYSAEPVADHAGEADRWEHTFEPKEFEPFAEDADSGGVVTANELQVVEADYPLDADGLADGRAYETDAEENQANVAAYVAAEPQADDLELDIDIEDTLREPVIDEQGVEGDDQWAIEAAAEGEPHVKFEETVQDEAIAADNVDTGFDEAMAAIDMDFAAEADNDERPAVDRADESDDLDLPVATDLDDEQAHDAGELSLLGEDDLRLDDLELDVDGFEDEAPVETVAEPEEFVAEAADDFADVFDGALAAAAQSEPIEVADPVDQEFSLDRELNALLGSGPVVAQAEEASVAGQEPELEFSDDLAWDGEDADLVADAAPVEEAPEATEEFDLPELDAQAFADEVAAADADDLPEFDEDAFSAALATGLDDDVNVATPPPPAAAAAESKHDPLDVIANLAAKYTASVNAAAAARQAASEPASVPEALDPEGDFDIPANAFDEAPDVETVDVVDHPIALADDLDIPEISEEESLPPVSAYDDLDAEFASLLSEMNGSEAGQRLSSNALAPAEPQQSAGYAYGAAVAATAAAAAAAAASARRPAPAVNRADPYAGGKIEADTDGLPGSKPVQAAPQGVGQFDYDPDLDDDMAIAAVASEERARPPRRGMLIGAIVGGVALLGGLGAFALSYGDGSGSDAPVIVKADDSPIKVKPEKPGGTTVPNQESKVYDTVAGTGTAPDPQQEKLVTTAEEPVDMTPGPVEEEPADEDAGLVAIDPLEPAAKSEDRIEQILQEDVGGPDAQVAAVSPRKVRTMIVKPDGTLVAREEPAAAAPEAGSAAGAMTSTATDLPTESAVPQDIPTGEDPVTGEAEVPAAKPRATAAAEPAAVAPAAPKPSAEPEATVAAVEPAAPATSSSMPDVVPIAPQRPAEQPIDVVGEVKPDKVAAVATSTGAWSMQIASQPSEAAAQSSYQDLARRFGGVLGGREVNIVKAEIAGKGTFWRVRVPTGSRNEAISLCESYKSAGGNCFVSR